MCDYLLFFFLPAKIYSFLMSYSCPAILPKCATLMVKKAETFV